MHIVRFPTLSAVTSAMNLFQYRVCIRPAR